MLSNANAIALQCQIYQVKFKESKQKEKKLGKFTAKGKSGGRQKKDKSGYYRCRWLRSASKNAEKLKWNEYHPLPSLRLRLKFF